MRHLNTEQYAIGFKKGNDELCDIVNADLQKLADDGTVAELAEKYEIADMVTLKASDETDATEDNDAEGASDDAAAAGNSRGRSMIRNPARIRNKI